MAHSCTRFSWLQGIPFRTSHDIVGKAVAKAVSKRSTLAELSLEEFKAINPAIDEEVYKFLGVENAIKNFKSYGSSGQERVAEQLQFWREQLKV